MRVYVSCKDDLPPGWTRATPTGLPDTDDHIDRIVLDVTDSCLDLDELETILELWLLHPQVTTRTLLAVTGIDLPRAKRHARNGTLTREEYDALRRSLPERVPTGGEVARTIREAGWGVAHPYSLDMLLLDQWPIQVDTDWQFGALCRAIKPANRV